MIPTRDEMEDWCQTFLQWQLSGFLCISGAARLQLMKEHAPDLYRRSLDHIKTKVAPD